MGLGQKGRLASYPGLFFFTSGGLIKPSAAIMCVFCVGISVCVCVRVCGLGLEERRGDIYIHKHNVNDVSFSKPIKTSVPVYFFSFFRPFLPSFLLPLLMAYMFIPRDLRLTGHTHVPSAPP